jgi:trk system potassium uptake protein TrkH
MVMHVDSTVGAAMLIVLCYVAIYAVGTILGVACGYELVDALFDAVSAGSNSGLSCGVTSPAMPAILKVTYILEMWMGRLEFISVFALGGYLVSFVKGK